MLSVEQVWLKVKQLEGKILYTYDQLEENKVVNVEDTGSDNDRVIIENRDTMPIKQDIWAAYELLYKQGKLERKEDLAWLEELDKQTSSIIFRIIGEITKNEIIEVQKRPIVLKLK
jgi:hypothetical protein